ncbi:MAG: FAD-dependent oxidoreductase [Acidobacteria bacterium]|nr:FAD-dependent oxidoreductase [Acidobacteriota bacterium]
MTNNQWEMPCRLVVQALIQPNTMSDTVKRSGHLVVVIGAGPAGIYGARKLAEAGHEVLLLNRDIKPGGLAEYGIYFNKYRMKEGIRAQFRKILSDPHIQYLGNVRIGNVRIGHLAEVTLDELRATLNPSAIVVAAGAQGTKFLGIPGEQLPGVYHAKDLVYHYNELPPFSQQHFQIGQRVAIVGIGNVMVDIAHWLTHEKKVAEVIAVARRGPAQRAYTDQEIKSIAANIDTADLRAEIERVRARLGTDSENVEAIYQLLTKHIHEVSKDGDSPTQVKFRFLSSPVEILHDADGHPRALRVENTELVPKGEDFSARGLGTFTEIEADTIIFAVGDSVDFSLGLPCGKGGYATNPNPDAEHPGTEAYEVFDPESDHVIPGTFVIGWSRQASDGLVGKARQDGERGVAVVNHYLETVAPQTDEATGARIVKLIEALQTRGVRPVTYAEVQRLEAIEKEIAAQRGLEYFRFATNEAMFTHLA